MLADLEVSGAAPAGAAHSASAGGYSVLVVVTPAGPGEGSRLPNQGYFPYPLRG
jgi:hypothetical protein